MNKDYEQSDLIKHGKEDFITSFLELNHPVSLPFQIFFSLLKKIHELAEKNFCKLFRLIGIEIDIISIVNAIACFDPTNQLELSIYNGALFSCFSHNCITRKISKGIVNYHELTFTTSLMSDVNKLTLKRKLPPPPSVQLEKSSTKPKSKIS